MKAKTGYGSAEVADDECRALEEQLNAGLLGRRRNVARFDLPNVYLSYRELPHPIRSGTEAHATSKNAGDRRDQVYWFSATGSLGSRGRSSAVGPPH